MISRLLPIDKRIRERVDQIELPFSRHGIDPFGIDKRELARFYTAVDFLYNRYFKMEVFGIDHIPSSRAMLVGNHSGGVALDGVMVIASLFFERNPPRLVQAMTDKFLARIPFSAEFTARIGQITGIPEHAKRFLEAERLLAVFPEGHRGTAKLAKDADTLTRFGTGFMRMALASNAPIVPTAFVGGGEAFPTFTNLEGLGKLLGLPYIPVTKYLLPIPRPTSLQLIYGEPMYFEGNGREDDQTIQDYVDQVKARIAGLIKEGRNLREGKIDAHQINFAPTGEF